MVERCRPVMAAWAAFLAGGAQAKVVPITAGKKLGGQFGSVDYETVRYAKGGGGQKYP
jgi:hypothetical protein